MIAFIGGYTIPAGVTACISPFAVARDPEVRFDCIKFFIKYTKKQTISITIFINTSILLHFKL